MKRSIKNPFVHSVLITVLGLILAGGVAAQTFTTLYSFTATAPNTSTNTDGGEPIAGVVLLGNTLHGTAREGGSSDAGTVFSLSFLPKLTIIPSGPYVLVTWPTNYAGFDYTGFTLQSTTSLLSPVWTTVSPGPVVIGGQN